MVFIKKGVFRKDIFVFLSGLGEVQSFRLLQNHQVAPCKRNMKGVLLLGPKYLLSNDRQPARAVDRRRPGECLSYLIGH